MGLRELSLSIYRDIFIFVTDNMNDELMLKKQRHLISKGMKRHEKGKISIRIDLFSLLKSVNSPFLSKIIFSEALNLTIYVKTSHQMVLMHLH